jgi:hypothetical protein
MKEIIKSIPWSGVGFIMASVILFGWWAKHREFPFVLVLVLETGLFFLCFYIVDKEAARKK